MPPKIFPIPDGVVSVYINPQSGKLATAACPEKELETFISGTEPTEYCEEHSSGGETSPAEGAPDATGQAKEEHSLWSEIKRWWMN
ncbi:hypothetical protein D3C73_977080 [compost metagenome]